MSGKRPVVGVVQGRSDVGPPSLRDEILEGEVLGEEEIEEAEVLGESEDEDELPEIPVNSPKNTTKNGDVPTNINYFGGLDDIISNIYEKEAAAYKIVGAVAQLFESRGVELPFDQTRFQRICENLALAQATREIAWLYGLGPEHADRAVKLVIDKCFGPPRSK